MSWKVKYHKNKPLSADEKSFPGKRAVVVENIYDPSEKLVEIRSKRGELLKIKCLRDFMRCGQYQGEIYLIDGIGVAKKDAQSILENRQNLEYAKNLFTFRDMCEKLTNRRIEDQHAMINK